MDDNNIKIRKAMKKDYKILANLATKTFLQTYQDKVEASDINSYVKIAFNEDKTLKEIKDPSFTILIALKNSKPVGYAKLLKSEIPTGSRRFNGIELVRLYVLKEYLKQKIGSKLLKKCIKIAKKKKNEFMWTGVWENNDNAVTFYKKSGFKKFGHYKFNFGTKIHNDLLMKLKIS
ncbi:GNAT family N-acetyltransferase [Candidatus Woesearchaeota archaeon]|nr:GNAT family N-acetyltransferase [Candidatus Woesearchaeota archaeon]